jgi:hypothetical protein
MGRLEPESVLRGALLSDELSSSLLFLTGRLVAESVLLGLLSAELSSSLLVVKGRLVAESVLLGLLSAELSSSLLLLTGRSESESGRLNPFLSEKLSSERLRKPPFSAPPSSNFLNGRAEAPDPARLLNGRPLFSLLPARFPKDFEESFLNGLEEDSPFPLEDERDDFAPVEPLRPRDGPVELLCLGIWFL